MKQDTVKAWPFPTTRIFFHYKKLGKTSWEQEERDFARVPAVGEYIAIDPSTDDLYRVAMVQHNAFPADDLADFIAEVYTVYAGSTSDVIGRETEGSQND